MSTIQDKIQKTLREKAGARLTNDLENQRLGVQHIDFSETIGDGRKKELIEIASASFPSTRTLQRFIVDVLFDKLLEQYEQAEINKYFGEIDSIRERLNQLEGEM